jgi:radical SAM-linked protein
MAQAKYRIRFRKSEDLRLISHHDLMRCFERLLRRAGLRLHFSNGFNPKPSLVFALSLGLGILGHEEVVEIELDEPVPPLELQGRLSSQAPRGLEFLDVRQIGCKQRASVRAVQYRIALGERPADLEERLERVLASSAWTIERQRPTPRSIDLRPYIRSLWANQQFLHMDLWVTPQGTARAEEILTALELRHRLSEGAVLERTRLELSDELENFNPDSSTDPALCPAKSPADDAERPALRPSACGSSA